MSDWPGGATTIYSGRVISSGGLTSMTGQYEASTGISTSAAAWPAANLALYIPVVVEYPCTVYKMSFQVGAQAGNYDIGIYDQTGVRLVNLGSTAVPAAGIAIADIADTALSPGTYFLAMNVDTITTLTIVRSAPTAVVAQALGVQQQAVGAVTLPSTATFANPANAYCPIVNAHLQVTV